MKSKKLPPQLLTLEAAIHQRRIVKKALAEAIGCDPNSVRRWFMRSTNRRNPSLPMLAKMEAYIYSHAAPK